MIELYQACYINFHQLIKNLQIFNKDKNRAKIGEIIVQMIYFLDEIKINSNQNPLFSKKNFTRNKKMRKNDNLLTTNYMTKNKKNKEGHSDTDSQEMTTNKIYTEVYKQFLCLSDINGSNSLEKSMINLELVSKIMESKLSTGNFLHIRNFQLYQVEAALASATFDEDADIKGEIDYLKTEMSSIKTILLDI